MTHLGNNQTALKENFGQKNRRINKIKLQLKHWRVLTDIFENIVPIRKKRALGSVSIMLDGDLRTHTSVMMKNMAIGINGLIASVNGLM